MKTIKIPYYKETIDIHVAEENLKAVITAKMHEYKAEKGEKELVGKPYRKQEAFRACRWKK